MQVLQQIKYFAAGLALFFLGLALTGPLQAEQGKHDSATMTVDRLETVVKRLDTSYARNQGMLQFSYGGHRIDVITDANANRMRIMIPVARADNLSKSQLYRIMQANFDSALDARYAIAQEVLWSTFLHPLGSLTEEDFLSGVGQAINIVTSFGSTYSSGVFTFGAGDSGEIMQRELLDELQKRGRAI